MLLDLDFKEDSHAQVDMNLVMTERGDVVEIQGTAEDRPFSMRNLIKLIELAEIGMKQVISVEKEIIGELC
jgi:ribonuclease PH